MPGIFNQVDISQEEKKLRKDYFDRHTPFVLCNDTAHQGENKTVVAVFLQTLIN